MKDTLHAGDADELGAPFRHEKEKRKTLFCAHCVIAMVSSWHAGNVMG